MRIVLAAMMPWLAGLALAAEPRGPLVLLTAQTPTGELAGWKSYSEDPRTATGQVWRLLPDGVLVCRGKPNGYLYTERSWRDFSLSLQWRTPEGRKPGRGGILIRMTGKHKIWPRSLEAQLNAGDEGDFWGLDGFTLSGPASHLKVIESSPFGKLTHLKRAAAAVRPAGQWNRYEIIAQGGTVILKINGQEVNRASDCDTHAGPICLTAEGDEIHFRDIVLTPLEPTEE